MGNRDCGKIKQKKLEATMRKSLRGFTVIEACTVIAIIALLTGMLTILISDHTKKNAVARSTFLTTGPTVTNFLEFATTTASPQKVVGELYYVVILMTNGETIAQAVTTHTNIVPGQRVAVSRIQYKETALADVYPVYWAEPETHSTGHQ